MKHCLFKYEYLQVHGLLFSLERMMYNKRNMLLLLDQCAAQTTDDA